MAMLEHQTGARKRKKLMEAASSLSGADLGDLATYYAAMR
jgi:hypothetical protein